MVAAYVRYVSCGPENSSYPAFRLSIYCNTPNTSAYQGSADPWRYPLRQHGGTTAFDHGGNAGHNRQQVEPEDGRRITRVERTVRRTNEQGSNSKGYEENVTERRKGQKAATRSFVRQKVHRSLNRVQPYQRPCHRCVRMHVVSTVRYQAPRIPGLQFSF